uniref:Uncharacterized protein n=1 Tax=Rattus norvegicus TaxID=10116 RepID=Q0ZFT1_RAT|nr:unknown [Rattus norvegicus]
MARCRQVKVLISKASVPEFNPQSLRPGEREACTRSPSDKRPLWLTFPSSVIINKLLKQSQHYKHL